MTESIWLNGIGIPLSPNHTVNRIYPVNGAQDYYDDYYNDNFEWDIFPENDTLEIGPYQQWRRRWEYQQQDSLLF